MASLTKRIQTILNIHPSESRLVALVTGLMLSSSAGFTLGSTGIETLFFTRFGVKYLPLMYMLLGVVSFITSLGITALLARLHRENFYTILPGILAGLTVIAWAALSSKFSLVHPVLWLGKEVANFLMTIVTWGIAGTVFDTRQSKRLFPLFNAGRILGAVLGGFGTGLLVHLVGTQNLLLAWAGLLVITMLLTRTLMKDRIPAATIHMVGGKKRQPALLPEMRKSYRFIRESALMHWISAAAVLFSILYFSIALPFSKSAIAQYPDENALAGFLGLFNGLSTAAAFLTSIFLANRIFARFGIMSALLSLPVLYMVGFGSLVLSSAFAVIVLFRFIQMVWLPGIADPAYQALFNAVPGTHRDKVRAFLDGIPSQAGVVLAGLILIIGDRKFSAQQLAGIGLVTAIITTFIIKKAGGAYNQAILDIIRRGRVNIFGGEFHSDAATLHAALGELQNPDPVVRRLACEILSRAPMPSAIPALVEVLHDDDADVRVAALKTLSNLQATPALLDITALLADPVPAVRAQAVDTLHSMSPFPSGLETSLTPLLDDIDLVVRVRAIVALSRIDPTLPTLNVLHETSLAGDENHRVLALHALAEIGGPEAVSILHSRLEEGDASISIRCAAVSALGSCGIQAIPILMKTLASGPAAVQTSAAGALARIGEPAVHEVIKGLENPATEFGALLALTRMPAGMETGQIRVFAQRRIESSIRYQDMRLALEDVDDERVKLLADSLGHRARQDSIHSLLALSLLNDRDTITTALESLQKGDTFQTAYALESLESIHEAARVRPSLRVWESTRNGQPAVDVKETIHLLRNEQDDWLRSCADFASTIYSEETPMEISSTLSIMERVVVLRHVPLLAVLPPMDLQRIAEITKEQVFLDGELICAQGEPGDELYVIVSGNVRVVISGEGQEAREIAKRGSGEVVGEMSIISGDTRMASVIAQDEVHALSLDRLSFESLLRERPEVSLALMRHLYQRLRGSG